MTHTPQASVIIPTYGRPELLLACVASILCNDVTDFEILVVDQDPAKSLEAELVKRFNQDPRIVYLFLDQAGASRARNMGIEHARGEIIVFVDDDLEVVPGWLQAYVNVFTTVQPPPGIVGGRVSPLWLAQRPEWFPEDREYLLGLYNKADELIPMPEGDLPFTANCATLRRTIDQVGMLDERIGFSYARKASMLAGEDSLFALKVKQAGYSIYYQPRASAQHKISKNKLTKKYFVKRHFWEGATTVVVLHLSGADLVADLPGVIRWHIGAIGRHLWHAVFPIKESQGNLLQAKARMQLAGACAYSLGAIYASAKLLWTHKLP